MIVDGDCIRSPCDDKDDDKDDSIEDDTGEGDEGILDKSRDDTTAVFTLGTLEGFVREEVDGTIRSLYLGGFGMKYGVCE